MQASRSSADGVRWIGQSQMGLILICMWILVMCEVKNNCYDIKIVNWYNIDILQLIKIS